MATPIDVEETDRLLALGHPVIDVLPAESYRRAHIPGARSVPLDEDGFSERIQNEAPDPDEPIVVYCNNARCETSPMAAHILEDHLGYSDVRHFEGGLAAWRRSGREFEGEGRRRIHAREQ